MNLYKYPLKNSGNQFKSVARLNRGSFIREIQIKGLRYSLILIGVYDFKRELISRRMNGEMIVETVSCPAGTKSSSVEHLTDRTSSVKVESGQTAMFPCQRCRVHMTSVNIWRRGRNFQRRPGINPAACSRRSIVFAVSACTPANLACT